MVLIRAGHACFSRGSSWLGALRYELSRFYAEVEVRLDPVDYASDPSAHREAVRSIRPVEIQLLIRERCLDSEPLM